MRLTRFTDYALRVLIYLAIKPDDLATIGEIAEKYQISQNHLMKIVHKLGKYGYVATVRGRQGGIRLARPPKAINIGEFVRRFEEDLLIVECFDGKNNSCCIAGACGLAGILNDALVSFLKTLDAKTLADVLKNSPGIGRRFATIE